MIKDKENITIVMVTENNKTNVKKAVNSITAGFRPPDQVIIGDNDSTDGTYDILCELLGAQPVTIDGNTGMPPEFDGILNGVSIKIFRQRKGTTARTLNTAIQMKWQGVTIFGFIDPNSWYAPDKISQAVCVFNQFPQVACVVSDCDLYHLDGRVERIFRPSFDIQKLLAGHQYDRNLLVRSNVFPQLKSGFNEQMSDREDYDFLLRISEIGLIYHIPAPLHNNIELTSNSTNEQQIDQHEQMARNLALSRRNSPNG